MARNETQANVTVTLNGETARNEMKKLEEELKNYRDMAEQAYFAGDKALGDKLTKKVERLEKEFRVATNEMRDFSDFLKKLNSKTLNELKSAAIQLRNQLRQLPPDCEDFIKKSEQFKQVNARIKQLEGSFKGLVEEEKRATFSLKGLADGFNKYFGMVTAGIAAVTGVSMAFRKAAEDAATLDDVYADVMKTTGLLHEQVADLDKELMKIDTRTSREQLLLLARDAGKLGNTGKEDILGFVRAADQIQVALGEDLGEGAIKNLGKIADVFGLTKEMGIEKSLLSIASAVNALGQASTASEAYLVDFTQRLAGVGAMAGLSVQDILGFASGLDQSAMKVEMAATAFQKFLMSMYEEPAKFAKYAGMEVEAFTDLLKTNANEAITVVMKAMNGQDGFAAMVPIFNEMGLDGARAVGVLSAMTKNLDAVTEAQALANVEFDKATSVTEEYNTKNNNLQAQLEKARKEFYNASVTLGQSLNPVMLKSTKATTYLIKALVEYGKEIKAALIALAAYTIAIKSVTIVHAAYNVVVKTGKVFLETFRTVVLAVKVAVAFLTGQTEKAAAAQVALNAAMSTNVFGLIATAVATLTVAIAHWVKKSKEANGEMTKMEEIQKRINSEYAEGAAKVETLTKIVHNNNIRLDERRRALEELKKIVPGYHADLTKEGMLINDNTDALKEYLKNLEKATRAKVLNDEYEKAVAKVLEAEKTLEQATQNKQTKLEEAGGDNTEKKTYVHTNLAGQGSYRTKLTPYGEAVQQETDAIDALNEAKNEQIEIEQRINKEYGIRAGQISDEDQAIREINDNYKQLFNEINEQYRDNPAAGEEARQNLEKQKRDEIAAIRKKYEEKRKVENEETATTNDILSKAQFEYLQERSDKLTKKEKEMVGKEYTALSKEESQALKARYDKLMKADQKLGDQRYQNAVKDLEKRQRIELNDLNESYFKKEITAEQHEAKLHEISLKYLEAKKQLALENNKDTSQIEAAILDERIKQRDADYKKELKQLEAKQTEEERLLEKSKTEGTITEDEYNSKILEMKVRYLQERLQLVKEYGQDEETAVKALLDAEYESEKLAREQLAKLRKEAKETIEGLRSPSDARNAEMQAQLKRLDVLHDAMLLSEKQYEEAVKQLRKKYADEDLKEKLANVQKYSDQVNNIMAEASNCITAIKEAESAKLEAQYQADLTAAGDNAEKREQIEAEYEQKQLDLKKRYADTEMAINIAKTIASGAVAAIKAYAEGGPYLGIALAALIAATTAAEVATIIAQRNAIKATTVSNSSSSSGTSPTLVTPTGYSGGGFTDKAANDNKPVGIVHANEWVAPAPMVRRNPVLFANLEQYRKIGFQRHSHRNGFASGGFTGSGSASSDDVMQKMLSTIDRLKKNTAANTAALNRLMDEGVPAYEVYDQHQSFETQRKRFKNATKR